MQAGKDVSRVGWQKMRGKRDGKSLLKNLWPNLAGHKPLNGNEGNNRLDNYHHPGSVVHDLAGVQA